MAKQKRNRQNELNHGDILCVFTGSMDKKCRSKKRSCQKEFHLGDILCVIAGRLIRPRPVYGWQYLLEFLIDGPVWSHQLCEMSNICRPFLLEQLPQLKTIDISGLESRNSKIWLEKQISKFGVKLIVSQIPTKKIDKALGI